MISVDSKNDNGTTLVEVRFERTPDANENGKLEGGVLFLDPSRGWVPIAENATCRINGGLGNHYCEFSYEPGSVKLKRVVEKAEYKLSKGFDTGGDTWHCQWVWDYDVGVPDRLPEVSEFTLSAFGLPEPVGVKWEKPTPRYIWFLLAAGVFALLAISHRFFARRMRAARPPIGNQPQVSA